MCKQAVVREIEYTFSHFNPYQIIDRKLVSGIANDTRSRPSLAPVVWPSGVLMANEAIKVMTGAKHTDHAGIFYNQYDHQILPGNVAAAKIIIWADSRPWSIGTREQSSMTLP